MENKNKLRSVLRQTDMEFLCKHNYIDIRIPSGLMIRLYLEKGLKIDFTAVTAEENELLDAVLWSVRNQGNNGMVN